MTEYKCHSCGNSFLMKCDHDCIYGFVKINSVKWSKISATDKYKGCNHHHELTDQHQIVDFGEGEFVANVQAIPLLKALNEAGLKTRTHHMDYEKYAFVSILLDNVTLEIKTVFEKDATRTKYNGKTELLISWAK